MRKVIIILILLTSRLLSQDKIVLGTFHEYKGGYELLKEVYRELNIEVEFRHYPGARSLTLANKGVIDGEIIRTEEIEPYYENLIRIPVPILYSKISGFKLHSNKTFDSKNMNNFQYGIIRGMKVSVDFVKEFDHYIYNTYEELFAAVKNNIHLIGILPTQYIVDYNDKHGKTFYIITPPFIDIPLYHYLNSKNSHLINRLTNLLKSYDESGRLDELRYK